jgi:hypothetical protein
MNSFIVVSTQTSLACNKHHFQLVAVTFPGDQCHPDFE